MAKVYLTTTLPYVNAAPHIGFALEMVQADAVARHERSKGNDVVFNTGTDEHGLKIYRKALEEKKDVQAYVDENAAKFDRLKSALNLSYTNFIRTTDPHHQAAAQEFWRRCAANGDIEKKPYKVKYCVGCELEKSASELVDGKCPIHPTIPLEEIEEENYFFRFSKYQEPLLKLYDEHPDFVIPEWRLHEVKNFVAGGLADFSISRLKAKMPWGVPVPGDDRHVMYVWFDALVNYISTIGWPDDFKSFETWWPVVQFGGKDQIRQQAAMWQAMLMSAGLPQSKQIMIHGFITSGGEKMSKSAGNVVDPIALAGAYGTDALRYWLLREMSPFEDGDFGVEKLKERYNGELANGLGNLVARVAALGEKCGPIEFKSKGTREKLPPPTHYEKLWAGYRFNEILEHIWSELSVIDKYINDQKLWEQDEKLLKHGVAACATGILYQTELFEPFLPETAKKIREQLSLEGNMLIVKKGASLFPRIAA
jgi:methionyl-tRNA synthetase